MNKELLLKILSVACTLLLVVTLILSVCLVRSCSQPVECEHDDDDYLYIGDIGKDNGDDDDDREVNTKDEWYDLDLPATKQSIALSISQIADKIEMRIANHSEYADSKVVLNGKNITHEGTEIDIQSGYSYEQGDRYRCDYTITGNNIHATPICITPCAQEWVGSYSIEINDLTLGASVSNAKEIRFDINNGITIKHVEGEFIFVAVPARGGTIPFAYGQYLTVKGSVDEPSDITLKWDDERLIIESSTDIQGFGASTDGWFSENASAWADEVKNEYRIKYISNGIRYKAEIE